MNIGGHVYHGLKKQHCFPLAEPSKKKSLFQRENLLLCKNTVVSLGTNP